ncbi:MAG: hypothetical protein HY543_04375, partial [Deltaproteobacteria bacterium]|nr:hypothetical protein [Deltaproteobacteria bacterium]
YGPSCTIGPKNTIGVSDPADTTGKKLVTIGVHVPATGQQVTVTQNTITTVLDKDTNTDSLTDTKRIVLDKAANDNIVPPPIIMEPKDASNLWVTFNAEHTIITSLVGVLGAEGVVELFDEPPPAQFIKTCAPLKKDADHYATLNVPDATWLYVCDQLSLLYNSKDTVVSLVYTHEGNSAPYKIINIGKITTLLSPVGATMGEGGAVTGSPAGGSDVGSSGAGITTVAMADGPGAGPIAETPAVGGSTPSAGEDTEAKPKAGAVAMDPGAIPEGGLAGGSVVDLPGARGVP